MERSWSHKDYQIQEGLKPGSTHFQYFFVVSRGGENRCKYCVWIENEALSRFDESKDFKAIASARSSEWDEWVKHKIDQEDFRDVVLKFDKEGEKEIDLSEMDERLRMD